MTEVDHGIFGSQKMRDFAYGLSLSVGGQHKRRVEDERKRCDRPEMQRILGDWAELDTNFTTMSQQEVVQKIITLLESNEIRLNPLVHVLKEQGMDSLR